MEYIQGIWQKLSRIRSLPVRVLASSLILLSIPVSLAASGDGTHEPEPGPPVQAEIVERLGDHIPLDPEFTNSSGQRIVLGDLLGKPTILSFVYFSCTSQCPLLLTNLATALSKSDLRPGLDYRVITVSFDDRDTPVAAAEKKKNAVNILGSSFPEDEWVFLTGDSSNISALADATGFTFIRRDQDFFHPISLIVISPTGKIARYLYGASHLPFSLSIALAEAEKEKTGISVRKVLSYCYTYDPKGKRYTLNLLRISGAVIVAGLIIFIGAVIFTGRKKPQP